MDAETRVDDRSVMMPQDACGLDAFWHPAAPSARLKDKPLTCNVLGHELALFRDGQGVAHALLDRCCHRGVRLSLGEVKEGMLACRYHGWRYDGTGRCVHIPSLPEGAVVKRSFATRAYPCAERDGYVWVHVSARDTELPPVPSIPGFDGNRWSQGTMPFACHWMAGIENNLDWCHATFTHPWSHPHDFAVRLRGLRAKPYELRLTDAGMVMFAPPTEDAAPPIPRHALRIHFDLPNRIRFCPRGEKPLIVLHFVPTGPSACRLEWMARRILSTGPKLTWTARDSRVFAQDRAVLESAQSWYDRDSGAFEHSVEADTATLLARRMVDLALAGVWECQREQLPQRRIVQARA